MRVDDIAAAQTKQPGWFRNVPGEVGRLIIASAMMERG